MNKSIKKKNKNACFAHTCSSANVTHKKNLKNTVNYYNCTV